MSVILWIRGKQLLIITQLHITFTSKHDKRGFNFTYRVFVVNYIVVNSKNLFR